MLRLSDPALGLAHLGGSPHLGGGEGGREQMVGGGHTHSPMASPCSDTMEVKSLMIWFTSNKSLCGNRMEAIRCLEAAGRRSGTWPSGIVRVTPRDKPRVTPHVQDRTAI